MNEQLVQQLTKNVSKNPNYEIYHLKNYFGENPDNRYTVLEFTDKYIDENKEDWDTSGITDKELIEVLLNRIKTDKVCYTKDNSKQTNNCYKELFIETLELMLSTFE